MRRFLRLVAASGLVVLTLVVLDGRSSVNAAPTPAPSAAPTVAGAAVHDVDVFAGGSCAAGADDGTVRGSAFLRVARGDAVPTLPWRLTGTDVSTRTGSVRADRSDPENPTYLEVDVEIAGRSVGVTYTFALFDVGVDPGDPQAEPLDDVAEVTVIGCVVATASCEAVTFTNPAGNPAVDVSWSYGTPDEVDGPGNTLELGPGESAVRRTAFERVYWQAGSYGGKVTTAGRGDLPVPQGCDGPTLTVDAGCARPGETADVEITALHRPEEPIRVAIYFHAEPYDEKNHSWEPNGHRSDTWHPRLPAGGYDVAMYVDDDMDHSLAFRSVRVARCVTATVGPEVVSFTNPAGNLPVRVTYGPAASDGLGPVAAPSTVRVAPGRTVSRPWAGTPLTWSAVQLDPEAGSAVVERAGGRTAQAVLDAEPTPTAGPTPRPTPTAGPTARPTARTATPAAAPTSVPVGVVDDGLADTGGPTGLLPIALGGLVLLAGAAFAVRKVR